jgi:glycine/D-amino acid oxidase-like deaminating enzyme
MIRQNTAAENLTRQGRLRDATPLWATTPRISVITGKRPRRTDYDVVIVGAGISGALAAHALCDGKRSVLIVDRRKPVTGSSLASTAMIQHEIDVPLFELGRRIGREKAGRVWRRSAMAVERLKDIARSLRISCQFEDKSTLYIAGDTYGSRALAMEAEARRAAGLDAELLDADVLGAQFGIERTAAIRSHVSASANPAQLTAGILRSARSRGGEIVEGVEITAMRSIGGEVVLATGAGDLVGAGAAVFCTGYEFLEAVASRQHDIISTWALASRPGVEVPDWLGRYLVCEGSDPYLYFRTTPDRRLIVGGEDETSEDAFASTSKMRAKSRTIVAKLEKLLGITFGEPDFAWSAAFGTTPTGLPMIGAVPGHENVYAVMGFGGNGITFSQIAADIVCSAISGANDPDAALFAFRAK